MDIRDALPDDAVAACAVLRRSISELCIADHGNDPAILQRWLNNKTPETVAAWIARPDHSLLVAVEPGATLASAIKASAIVAVGAVTDAGEITLNYVSPDARFRGVSRALLGALEARAILRGNARCTLLSTETAHHFYHARGYRDDGAPAGKFGMTSGYPMSRLLAVPDS
jgi:GNAT superfamily N-acetyltransferase